MARTRVLITVKTYPTISTSYDELVCTAGFLENGEWIRIYPVPFRKKPYGQQYKKYDWIELDLVKNKRDFRPESYRPHSEDDEITVVGHVDTQHDWAERKELVLQKVYTNLATLIAEAKDQTICTSLAVFKPTEILDFVVEEVEREWDDRKLASLSQMNLFENDSEGKFEVVKKLPYKFSYKFVDEDNKESTMMIEDWEIGQLYWNCLRRHEGNEELAIADVRNKYFDDFAKTKDLYLFLGTTQRYHSIAPNPFIIIGTFHPKKSQQDTLF
ncbi:MAG: hypothetical protein JNJ85_11745 [Candidatus Kapabacteria bacterium]|nr:hypothetical protein [Candidatus Kapabacteria bacterium]